VKVATVVGTRPEVIKLSRIIPELDKRIEHILIHTNQNYDYELNQIFFDELQIRKPDHTLLDVRTVRTGVSATPTEVIGNIMARLDTLLLRIKPDALLILGDTNSCFAAAYTAKRHKIPLFHMEAGNRCYDDRVPEEINRRIIDHISDINMPYSAIARECLVREGILSDRIIKTGSPMFEVIEHYKSKFSGSEILKLGLEHRKYFVVSCHREENVDSPKKFHQFCDLLYALGETYQQRVVVSAHPRLRSKLGTFGPSQKNIEIYKPFGFLDYIHLQMNARVTLSDSGTITEESAILNFPALNLREVHERPEGMEEGSVPLVGFNINRIFECISLVEKQEGLQIPVDYCVPNVAEKVVRIIMSYTDYVNRVVWSV